MPMFSIILATRDRPELFGVALDSVVAQTTSDVEVIVVNDGSGETYLPAYELALGRARAVLGDRLKHHYLVHRPNGHGQSYSLNFGVAHATGEYVGFLDDDDEWVDEGHLARAALVIAKAGETGAGADLYMANQHAYRVGVKLDGPVWLEGLEAELLAQGRQPAADGSFQVGITDLMQTNGFCHLNCFIVRRSLYDRIGGMDEGIRWECDRDVYLRLIDDSALTLHHPAVVSRHNVPDPAKATSMTTSLNQIQRRLYQLRVLDKAALFAKDPLIRAHGRLHKAHALKKIASDLAESGSWRNALYYAAQALGAGPTLKWFGFTSLCAVKSLFSEK